jgi:hypothetical protein
VHVAIHLSHFVWHHHQYIHVVHISSPWFPVNLTPSRSYTSQSILRSFRPQVVLTPVNPSSGHSEPKSFIHQSIHPQVIPTPGRSYTNQSILRSFRPQVVHTSINPSSGHSDPKSFIHHQSILRSFWPQIEGCLHSY